jgi:4-diphosphocytidyl-2-C-methyl-D-erythritol kinase
MTSREVEVVAPGKINLILRVLDRRPDGYHNLWSVMQTLDLADTVMVEEDGGTPGIRLSCEGADLPTGPMNLAYRAAERVLVRLGKGRGIRLIVRKRLPVAAGVGGGSSDAAATIRALATLFDTGWSREEMAAVGQEIGSDVPFFFYGPTALVEGRGDRVTPIQLDGEGWLVLVNPGIPIATAWAYAKLADSRATGVASPPFHPPLLFSGRGGEGAPSVTWRELLALMGNDFGPVVEQAYPVLRELRLLLRGRGAQAALLAGSGATVFGVFPSEVAAKSAAEGLDRRPGWRVWVTRTQRGVSRQVLLD